MKQLRIGRHWEKFQAAIQDLRTSRMMADRQAADRQLQNANLYLIAMAAGLGIFLLILWLIRCRII